MTQVVRALLVDVPGDGVEQELAGAGFEVVRAASISDVPLEDRLDVVLLRLAGARPLETFSVARSAVDGAPIVVLTDPGRNGDGEAAVRAGAEDHVPREALVPGLLPRVLRYAVDQHRMRRELRELEITDGLTGLPNLRGFAPVAEHRFRIADRERVPVVLLFVRLDDLGDLSTEPGALEADRVASEAAQVILDGVRDADFPCRVSASTFCVLLSGSADGNEAVVLSRLVEAIAVRNARNAPTGRLALSIGSAVYDPEHPASIEEIIETAERRMSEPSDAGNDPSAGP